MRRFRDRLRGFCDRWRSGTVTRAEAEQRVRAWLAHAAHADTWRLRRAIFRPPAVGGGDGPRLPFPEILLASPRSLGGRLSRFIDREPRIGLSHNPR